MPRLLGRDAEPAPLRGRLLAMADLHVYSILRNEAKILPYFLRHYETIASRIFVFDDNSDDGTLHLLRAHPKVTVLGMVQPWLRTRYTGGIDDRYFRQLHERAYTHQPRHADLWIACVDADEFLHHPNLLLLLDRTAPDVVWPTGYAMTSPTFPTTSGQIYEEARDGIPDFWSGKPCLFRSTIDIQFDLGRHGVKNVNLRVARDTGVKLLHYRYLGHDYTIARNHRNLSRMTAKNKNGRLGRHNEPDSKYQHSLAWLESNRRLIRRAV